MRELLRIALREILVTWCRHNNSAFVTGVWVLFITVFLYVIYRLVYHLKKKGRKQTKPLKVLYEGLLISLAGVYGYFLIAITLLSREAGSREGLNLELGATLRGSVALVALAFENLLLFIPFGVFFALLMWVYKGRCGKFYNIILLGALTSLAIETTQLKCGMGFFELDDIILNTAGSFAGYIIVFILWCIWNLYLKFGGPIRPFVQALPILVLLAVIFGFSAEPGPESGAASTLITTQIVHVADAILPGSLSEARQAEIIENLNPVIRKLAHMSEYAVLAGAFFYFLRERGLRRRLVFILSLVSTVVVAVGDEIHQLFVPGRDGALRDVGFDILGAVLLLTVVYLLTPRTHREMNKEQRKHDKVITKKRASKH
ncbi:MAG: VanZ family protein [Clostridia bacterium]|nr:VanZ family protein [Clostridia bacterium]